MSTDNRTIVQQGLATLLETGDADALGRFLSDDFVHHRPDSTTKTKAEWLASVGTAMKSLGDMRVEIRHLLADGDFVVVHSRRWLDNGPEITVVDICRVSQGRLSEIWEIIEPAASAAANLSWWEN